MKTQLKIMNLKVYIMMLCISDYILTYIGIQFGYVTELNPIMDVFLQNNQYTLGFIFKILLTLICLEIICLKVFNGMVIILNYTLCLYLSINVLHILYFMLWIIQKGYRLC